MLETPLGKSLKLKVLQYGFEPTEISGFMYMMLWETETTTWRIVIEIDMKYENYLVSEFLESILLLI